MTFEVIGTFFLVFLNGFFVAAEFAIVKVRASQLEVEVQAGNAAAILSKKIVSNLDGYLAATQLGITLASLGLGWVGEPVVAKIILRTLHLFGLELSEALAHNISLPIAFALITVLHIVFGELAPKSIAIQRSEKTTLVVAYPLQFFFLIFRPFIWVLNGIANIILRFLGIEPMHGSEVHSSDELKYLVQQGKESGAIEATNYDIIKNAFQFSEITAKQIMIPRVQMAAIDLKNSTMVDLEKVIEDNYSRIPCYEGTLDRVTGIIYLKDLLLQMRTGQLPDLRAIMRPVIAVPETKRIGQLLKDFQVKRQQIAIVVNEYGTTRGMVTMEDIIEELVGEIQDEYDNETPLVEKLNEHSFSILGSASVHDINKFIPIALEETGQVETLAGYIILRLGRIPNSHETFMLDGYECTIQKRIKNTIVMAQLRLPEPKDDDRNDAQ